MENTKITISAILNTSIETAWNVWITPSYIIQWNTASADWHTTKAENDLRAGGKFSYRMEARDGSMGFDFTGVYMNVIKHKHISYMLGDDREVTIDFMTENNKTRVVETFAAESSHSIELQREGWQAILNNFKKVAESKLN